jgi:hypothetical protein
VADERSATREKTRSIATERERDDYVFEWTGARLPPMADERSATREKTRSIATKRERDDYVFEWTGAHDNPIEG